MLICFKYDLKLTSTCNITIQQKAHKGIPRSKKIFHIATRTAKISVQLYEVVSDFPAFSVVIGRN